MIEDSLDRDPTLPSPEPSTLVDLLRGRADAAPESWGYVYLPNGESEEVGLDYGELDTSARAIAAHLAERGATGEPVLLCHPPGLDYVKAFFGCVYAGAIAVPAYPPERGRLGRTLPRLRAILENSGARQVLTDAASLEAVRSLQDELDSAASLTATDQLELGLAAGWKAPPVEGDTLAFLMYTSGSTGTPRGVMMSHGAVLANLAGFPGFAERPCRAFANWLPFFHDLGLMLAMLHPLYRGVPSIFMPPLAFVQRPARWPEVVSRYRATTTGGPDFAYGLCARRVHPEERRGLDLSSWNMALNGAEPVRRQTLDSFVQAFEPCGFRREALYPSYGLSDAAATVSGGWQLEAPRLLTVDRRALEEGRLREVPAADGVTTTTLVGCGRSLPGHEVAIVDPHARVRCTPDSVGEIWVAGASNGTGYWRRPEESRRTFEARLADGGQASFLRTGDLGFVRDDEVYVVGRLDDMLVLRGSNYHPEDVEPTVAASHPALRPGCGAVFAARLGDDDQLVVVQEADARSPGELPLALERIRAAVAEHHEVEAGHIVLIRPGSLPKTSSGKVRRRACRQQFLSGELEVLVEWGLTGAIESPEGEAPEARPAPSEVSPPTLAELRARVTDRLAERLQVGREEVGLDRTFTDYGMPSVEVVSLVGELATWSGRDLAPTVAWDFPTIDALLAHVAGEPAPTAAAARPGRRASSAVADDPIAIVGMACRLPGAPDLEALWRLLAAGRSGIVEVPPDRWDAGAFFDPDPAAPGKMVTRWGGFLEDLDRLDADFFGISPREARHVDPRQRLLLELTWEVLEDAGIPIGSLAGSRTGVFMASLSNDYAEILFRDLDRVDAYSGPGTANSILANRLSFTFDLRGPSLALDTACSGSLVGVHLACQSLRVGESDLALVGGVSVNLLPNGNIFFSKAGALAPDGRCKTFDRRADGMVRSDGAAIVALKRLSEAVAAADRIYAVIRGSAINQDGRSQGLMAPNGESQQAVLEDAYLNAGVSPGRVQYVEAHGTATNLGDPIELESLGTVLGRGRPPARLCAVGSIKTNLGHTEAAAGVAGLIKVALAMERRQLPPTPHFKDPNPLIPFEELSLTVQRGLGPWANTEEPLLAGVSSFGFGGTNAHVVVEEAPPARERPSDGHRAVPYLLPISARSPAALRARVEGVVELLDGGDPDLGDVVFTAAVRRSHLEHRTVAVGRTREELRARLDAFLDGKASVGPAAGAGRAGQGVVFVFSGQGTQYPGMGLELAAAEPVFGDLLEECDRLLRQQVDWSLLEELGRPAEESRLGETAVTQPAVFAVQVGLAALWRSWGIEPAAVVGQSLGEVAAAHVAGALDLEDAVSVVVHRARLMARAEGRGRTAVVGLSLHEAELVATGQDDRVVVAGSSSPSTSVLAGEPDALVTLLGALEAKGRFTRLIPGVEVAFHSPQMDPLVEELAAALASLRPGPTRFSMWSTVTGDEITGEGLGPEYWARNLRQPFLLSAAVERLIGQGYDSFLEISPQPVLGQALEQSLAHADRQGTVGASLSRHRPLTSLLSTLGLLHCRGVRVDWRGLYPAGRCISLPAYPWQRERYWYEDIETARPAARRRQPEAAPADGAHPLLGEHDTLAPSPGTHLWRRKLNVYSPYYLDDHRVGTAVVVPGAVYLEMALAALEGVYGGSGWVIRGARFEGPLVLPPEGDRWLQVILSKLGPEGARIEMYSRAATPEGAAVGWRRHASARVVEEPGEVPEEPEPLAAVRARCAQEVPIDELYAWLADQGLEYGASFRNVRGAWRGDREALGRIELGKSQQAEAETYRLHPALLDSCFQLVAAAAPVEEDRPGRLLPLGVDGVQLAAPAGAEIWCHCRVRESAASFAGGQTADLVLFADSGELVARVDGLRLGPAVVEATSSATLSEWVYRLDWPVKELVAGSAPGSRGSWLLLEDAGGAAQELGRELTARGERVCFAPAGPEGADEEVLTAAFQEASGERQAPLRGVVCLWGVDAGPSAEVRFDDIEPTAVRWSRAMPVLVRVLARVNQQLVLRSMSHQRREPRAKLWIVTQGAASAALNGDSPRIASAPLWGMGRALSQEHRDLWGGLVDLDPGRASAESAGALADELLAGDGEDQVALRGGDRRVCRLQPSRPTLGGPFRPAAEGSYLVTGGLGDLGLAVARRLVERGAHHLILLGRSGLPPREQWSEVDDERVAERVAAVRALEGLGAVVDVATVDVGDRAALGAFLAERRRRGSPPIRGVLHSAGVVRDQLLARTDPEAQEAVLRPKIHGAWLLHELLAEEPLEFFVLFSSLASVMPTLGQASYAGANAFLDSLAHYRRSRGLPAISLCWGPWSEVGMAARSGLVKQHSDRGVAGLPTEGALDCLERLLQEDAAQRIVVAADWAKILETAPVPPPLLEAIREAAGGAGGSGPAPGPSEIATELAATEPPERLELLVGHVKEVVGEVVGIEAGLVHADRPLMDLGIDSIMIAEIMQRLERELEASVAMVDLMGFDLTQLAVELLAQMDRPEGETDGDSPASAADAPAHPA